MKLFPLQRRENMHEKQYADLQHSTASRRRNLDLENVDFGLELEKSGYFLRDVRQKLRILQPTKGKK